MDTVLNITKSSSVVYEFSSLNITRDFYINTYEGAYVPTKMLIAIVTYGCRPYLTFAPF